MNRIVFLSTLIPLFCFAKANQNSLLNAPDTLPVVIVVNSFDASSLQVRKNKRELFKELADSLQVYLAQNIKTGLGLECVIIQGLMGRTDSAVHSLMHARQSTKAIVIRSVEVYFNEGAEKHTEEYGMSPKIETSYDLCSKITYALYTIDSASKESEVNQCDYFTSRSVNDSKLVIKFGPDIVGKKKHTYGAVEKNAAKYILSLEPFLKSN